MILVDVFGVGLEMVFNVLSWVMVYIVNSLKI